MNMRFVLLALWAVAGAIGTPVSATPQKKPVEPIRVFVFTAIDPSGFTGPDQKQRLDSVADLKKMHWGKTVEIVEKMEMADVTLEVLGRGGQEVGTTTTTSQGAFGEWNTTTSSNVVAVVNVGLRAGDYKVVFTGSSPPAPAIDFTPWRTAAAGAADQISRWLKQNHEQLIARRVARQ